MKGSLGKEFGGLLAGAGPSSSSSKKSSGETEAAQDMIDAMKDGDAERFASALKLFMEECGVYTKDNEEEEEAEDEEG